MGEGERLRAIRLAALRDAPDAFRSLPERRGGLRARGLGAARRRTVRRSSQDGDDWLGMAGALRRRRPARDREPLGRVGRPARPRRAEPGRGARRGAWSSWRASAASAALELSVTDRAPGAERALRVARVPPHRRDDARSSKRRGVTEARWRSRSRRRCRSRPSACGCASTSRTTSRRCSAIQSREDVTRLLPWGPRDPEEVRESLAKKLAATAHRAGRRRRSRSRSRTRRRAPTLGDVD